MSDPVVKEHDLQFLRRAIELALEARQDGRHPFGALIVNERGEVTVEALNNAVRPKGDPTQHAELLACAFTGKLPPIPPDPYLPARYAAAQAPELARHQEQPK